LSAEYFEREKARWIDLLGEDRVRALAKDLETISNGADISDLAGWLR
jgi:hypothetical protein